MKFIIPAFTFFVFFVGSIIALEDRYVSEAEAAKSLSSFNQKMSNENKMIKLQIQQVRYDNLINSYYLLLH